MYSEQISVSMTSGSASLTVSGSPAALMQGDALILAGNWYEVTAHTGATITVQPAYAGASQSGSVTLVRFASSQATPSQRLRAEHELDKLTQKLGQELIHFLSN